ncbi:App1 family protein [Pedobacter sp.]|uniref:App1 family protein n=1 Tax=Pedobacter sp. TaxID=1411316 RepID=UPI003D7F29A6
MNKSVSVKVYHGYGHTHNLVVYGHVFKYRAKVNQVYSNHLIVNVINLLKLFVVKPLPFARVRLHFEGEIVERKTEYDGFFRFEWEAKENVDAGWHTVKVETLGDAGEVVAECDGKLYVPHITQFAFVSDIDDTVMVSHSATILRRLRELFIKNPHTRKTFLDTQLHYSMLAESHTTKDQPNPFFYVSSSEWNLYDYLIETFTHNKLPEGAFLLNQLKQWKDLLKTGKTGHDGKLVRVMRIIDAFPKQRFIFFGDNSQQDPAIYTTIANKYPENVTAIYIRNVVAGKAAVTAQLLEDVERKGVRTCLFQHSEEAIAHSKKIGLIN